MQLAHFLRSSCNTWAEEFCRYISIPASGLSIGTNEHAFDLLRSHPEDIAAATLTQLYEIRDWHHYTINDKAICQFPQDLHIAAVRAHVINSGGVMRVNDREADPDDSPAAMVGSCHACAPCWRQKICLEMVARTLPHIPELREVAVSDVMTHRRAWQLGKWCASAPQVQRISVTRFAPPFDSDDSNSPAEQAAMHSRPILSTFLVQLGASVQLKSLKLCNNDIESEEFPTIAKAIGRMTALTHLNLSLNHKVLRSGASCKYLLRALAPLKALARLDMVRALSTAPCSAAEACAVPTLTYLDISGASASNATAWLRRAARMQRLQVLIADGIELNAKFALALAAAAPLLPALRRLSLRCLRISTKGFDHVPKADTEDSRSTPDAHNCKTTAVRFMRLPDTVTAALGDALQGAPQLTRLSLSRCAGRVKFAALLPRLADLTALQRLSLAGCKLKDQALGALAGVLPRLAALSWLDIADAHPHVSEHTVVHMLEPALAQSPALRVVCLCHKDCGPGPVRAAFERLQGEYARQDPRSACIISTFASDSSSEWFYFWSDDMCASSQGASSASDADSM